MSARGGRGQLHPTTQTFSARACSGWLRGVRDRASRRLGLTCHPWSGIWPTAVCTTTRPGTLDQPTGTRACPGQLAPTGNHPRHGGEGQEAERFFFFFFFRPSHPLPWPRPLCPGGEGGKGGRGRHPLHLPGLGSGRRTWGCWPTAKCASRHREVAGKYHLPGRRVARQRDMVREWGAKVDDPTRHAHADPPPSPPDQPTPPPGARSPFRSCLSWRTRPNTALSVYIIEIFL